MTTEWKRYQRGRGIERVLAMIERATGECRQLMADPSNQVYFGLAFRAEYVDSLFRKAVKCLEALSTLLNETREPGDLAGLLTQPLGEEGLTLLGFGLRRGSEGTCETDYLALEYALGQTPEAVLDALETLAREHLRPRLPWSSVAA